jgi:signal transduction histidine kinase
VLYVNAGIDALTPGGRAAVQGKSIRELDISPQQVEAWEAQARAAFATGLPQRAEICHLSPDGPRYFERTLVPELDSSGEAVSLLSLAYDVTARKQAEAALRQTEARLREALEQAELAVQTRDTLVALVSHDLRSPLNTLMLGISALEEELEGPQCAVLSRMARQTRRMEGLIDELLDVAQISAGAPLALKPAQTDLAALVRTLVQDHRGLSASHTLELAAPAAPLIGQWDTKRIARVVTNLLTNAIKYSPKGGRVAVRLSRAPGTRPFALVSVSDEGIGIAPEDRERIFDWFARGANARSTRIQGTGIGLAAAREIVQQHGGAIEVASVPGQGSTFTVRLPLAQLQPEPAGSPSQADHPQDPERSADRG